jgi:hypothetical protein
MKLQEIKEKYQNDFDIKVENGALIIKEKAVSVDDMILEVLKKDKTIYCLNSDSSLLCFDGIVD